jgi:DNA-binding Lrp family transcriptional regulator
VADIARTVCAQRDTVLYRIERLEKLGLIQKYHTIIEPSALGLPVFMLVLLTLSPAHEAQRGEFIQKLHALPYVTHIARIIGPYDYFVQIAAADINTCDVALSNIKTLVPGVVQSVVTAPIIDGIKTDDFTALV